MSYLSLLPLGATIRIFLYYFLFLMSIQLPYLFPVLDSFPNLLPLSIRLISLFDSSVLFANLKIGTLILIFTEISQFLLLTIFLVFWLLLMEKPVESIWSLWYNAHKYSELHFLLKVCQKVADVCLTNSQDWWLYQWEQHFTYKLERDVSSKKDFISTS